MNKQGKSPARTLFAKAALACIGALAVASPSWAATVDWADWTSSTPTTVSGTVTAGSSTVGVDYSGAQYAFTQLNNTGTNYYSPTAPYLSAGVSNAPGTTDIIALSSAGTSTITFSQAVVNPLIALVSWNGAHVTFGGGADAQAYDIQYLSSGCGFWGCGTYANPTANSFDGVGELHGVIELQGTYTSISFTDTTPENWHGLTVGFESIASSVPEAGESGLMLAGLLVVGLGLRRKPRG
jgi:hypothetical protein